MFLCVIQVRHTRAALHFEPGSRLVVVLSAIKESGREINYGSGRGTHRRNHPERRGSSGDQVVQRQLSRSAGQ